MLSEQIKGLCTRAWAILAWYQRIGNRKGNYMFLLRFFPGGYEGAYMVYRIPWIALLRGA
jgi:hypothetical protein